MVTKTFLVGVLVGLLLAAATVYMRDKAERLENIEEYLSTHPIPRVETQSGHGLSYGRPEQEAL